MWKSARKFIAAVAGALALATAASAGAQTAGPFDRCSIGGKYPVRKVLSYSTQENAGYTAYTQFRGADVFVPAQPGLTGEWLERVLVSEIANGACNFGVHDVSVSVMSAGGGFSVRLSGRDERAAGEILRNAQQLVK
jgi:uncharacterized membrane protein YdfJ with MMPL/SSD domain